MRRLLWRLGATRMRVALTLLYPHRPNQGKYPLIRRSAPASPPLGEGKNRAVFGTAFAFYTRSLHSIGMTEEAPERQKPLFYKNASAPPNMARARVRRYAAVHSFCRSAALDKKPHSTMTEGKAEQLRI